MPMPVDAALLRLPLVGALLLLGGCDSASASARHAATPGPVPPRVALTSQDQPSAATPPANQPQRADPAAEGPGQLGLALSHASYGRAQPQRLLLKVDYRAPAPAAGSRPPLNIALVLDHSGSMAQDRKLDYTLEAARQVVENLGPHDSVAIVAYNDRVTVLSAAGRAVNKPFLYHRLTELAPEGYTNLSAGLLEGIAQLESSRADGQVSHVLLLTDGLANRGVIGGEKLRDFAAGARSRGIGLSTLGCGGEYDEELLASLAEAGGGRYTYVKSPEQIPTAFEQELQGLLAVVAQNVALEVSVAGGQIEEVFGAPLPSPATTHRFDLGDVRAGEQGVFLLGIRPAAFEDGSAVEAEVRLTFDDAQTGRRLEQRDLRRSTFAQADAPDPSSVDSDVLLYGRLLEALELTEQAVAGLDEQRLREARAAYEELYEPARARALELRDQQLLNLAFLLRHFNEELAAAAEGGLIHGHEEARRQLQKDLDYQRYLMTHHRPSAE